MGAGGDGVAVGGESAGFVAFFFVPAFLLEPFFFLVVMVVALELLLLVLDLGGIILYCSACCKIFLALYMYTLVKWVRVNVRRKIEERKKCAQVEKRTCEFLCFSSALKTFCVSATARGNLQHNNSPEREGGEEERRRAATGHKRMRVHGMVVEQGSSSWLGPFQIEMRCETGIILMCCCVVGADLLFLPSIRISRISESESQRRRLFSPQDLSDTHKI